MMNSIQTKRTPHCLLVPYPIQGHINPMLQFAKRLVHKRLKVTFVVTNYVHKTMKGNYLGAPISVRTISDGYDEGGRDSSKNNVEYRARFRDVGKQTLTQLLKGMQEEDCPVDCVIYDPFCMWVVDIAKEFGFSLAAFFTQSCALCSIYNQVHTGELELPISDSDVVDVPGLPVLKPSETPCFVQFSEAYYPGLKFVTDQFGNIDKADWIFVNSFDKLEQEVIDNLPKSWIVKAVGPTVPSMYMDKRLQEDSTYGINIFKPITDSCLNWLNRQKVRSVIYVSFGSLAKLSVDQTEELAYALKTVNKPFLWVVRASEEDKLPENFINETSEKGMVVSWCPQLEVLSHRALGCFVTHCGWNSTLEALSLGIPLVAMPQWADQSTNAKFVEDVWEIGVRAQVDEEKELVRQEEIVRCVRHIMEGKGRERIRMNVMEWQEDAMDAVDIGGSSDRNIDEFVTALTKRSIL